MSKITVLANIDKLQEVLGFVEQELEKRACPMKVQMQMEIAVEEIFVNIAHYAYHPTEGEATIECNIEGEPLQISIRFLDQGKPFNPLDKAEPDVTLSAEERDVGGLGIYMVKKSMDLVEYTYENGSNILTIKKKVE